MKPSLNRIALAGAQACGPTNNIQKSGTPSPGLVKFEQESPGFRRDSNINYAAGLQAGMLQDLNKNASIEVGNRYLRTNASTDMAMRGGPRPGRMDLHSSSLAYVGANYKF